MQLEVAVVGARRLEGRHQHVDARAVPGGRRPHPARRVLRAVEALTLQSLPQPLRVPGRLAGERAVDHAPAAVPGGERIAVDVAVVGVDGAEQGGPVQVVGRQGGQGGGLEGGALVGVHALVEAAC